MFHPRQLLLISLSVVSCCCEGDMCPEEGPMMTASDSSVPPTSGTGTEDPGLTESTGAPTTTVEPTTTTTGTTSTSDTSDTDTGDTSDTDETGEPMCNNGVLEADEQCDDGDVGENKPCLPGCIENICGDSQLHPELESCDEGEQNGQYGIMCSLDCHIDGAEYCGDDILQPQYEDCEPGDVHEEFDIECDACFWSPYRVVFVSSIVFDGAMEGGGLPNPNNLSGLALADFRCDQLAENATLPGQFHAWLSDNNGTENHSNAADRIGGPGSETSYRMRNGGMVAPTWSELVEQGPSKPIVYNELGVQIDVIPSGVWTNTIPDGASAHEAACEGWTSNAVLAFGHTGYTLLGPDWTNAGDSPCVQEYHLYCFQGED